MAKGVQVMKSISRANGVRAKSRRIRRPFARDMDFPLSGFQDWESISRAKGSRAKRRTSNGPRDMPRCGVGVEKGHGVVTM